MKKHAWRNNKETVDDQESMQDNDSYQNKDNRKILRLGEEIVRKWLQLKKQNSLGEIKPFECW